MNKTIYKQLDSRWSSKPYPTKSSTFGGNGCGCCACTHIAIEQTSKSNWTPENLRTWMINQGYAYAGQGTSWEGITETLKYIGHKNVVRIYNDPMTEAWKELDKGNRIGVILFSAGYGGKTSGKKVYWTSGGHYIAFTDYKVENKKHYFYMKDSGGRGNDGWFSYEDSMYGVVAKVWIVEKISEEKKAYSGEFPTLPTKVTKTANQQCLEAVVAYAKKICADDSYGYKRATTNAQLKSCPICNPILGKNTNCIGFCGLSLKHGGGVPVKCAEDGLGNNNFFTKVTLSTWKKRNGNDWVMVSNGGKKGGKAIGKSSLKAGDVCIQYNTDGTSQHLCLYIGDGKVAEAATSSVKKAKQVRVADYSGRRVNRAFRYTGKGKFTDIVSTGYMKYGDDGAETEKLQSYLNWYKKYGLVVDGIWRDATDKAVKDMQTDFFGAKEADGLVGVKTIEKMKAVKK